MKKINMIISLIIVLLSLKATAQKKYAMLVGISNYHAIYKNAEWNNIHGVNDIELIAPILGKQGFVIDKVLDKTATKANIVKHLKYLKHSVSKGAIVYIQFSCHGQPYEDLNGDETDGWDESIVPVDAPISYVKGHYVGENHLVDDELNKYTEQIRKKIGPKGYLYVIIDACHAGRASRDLDELEITRGTKVGFSQNGRRYTAKKEISTHYILAGSPAKSRVTYLEACRNTQVNVEIKKNGLYYGPLSYHIAQVLSSHNLGADNKWAFAVQELMRKDISAQNQDMVIETTN